jgi:hypothetical protein
LREQCRCLHSINGGIISIATNNSSKDPLNGAPDATGILLAAGSLLDVCSGGYISPLENPETVAPIVTADRGGNILLALYQGAAFNNNSSGGSGPPTPSGGTVAHIQLDGTLRFGCQSGGGVTIGAPGLIQIGGHPHGVAMCPHAPGMTAWRAIAC